MSVLTRIVRFPKKELEKLITPKEVKLPKADLIKLVGDDLEKALKTLKGQKLIISYRIEPEVVVVAMDPAIEIFNFIQSETVEQPGYLGMSKKENGYDS